MRQSIKIEQSILQQRSDVEIDEERQKLVDMQAQFAKEKQKFAEKQKLAQLELNAVLEQIKLKEEKINKKQNDLKQ